MCNGKLNFIILNRTYVVGTQLEGSLQHKEHMLKIMDELKMFIYLNLWCYDGVYGIVSLMITLYRRNTVFMALYVIS